MRISFVFILFFSFLCVFNAQIKEGVALYEVVSKPMEEDKKMPSALSQFFNSLGDDNGEMFFITLSFNDQRSFSTYGKKISIDEVLVNPSAANIMVLSNPDICYNLKNNSITYNSTFKDTIYQVSKDFELEDWEFTQKEKIIDGYNCKEAIMRMRNLYGDNRIIKRVWYSEDIPVSIGPSRYLGFPGLVVFVSQSNLEIKLIDLVQKKVDVMCILEGIPISGVKMAEKKNTSFQSWKESFNKEKK